MTSPLQTPGTSTANSLYRCGLLKGPGLGFCHGFATVGAFFGALGMPGSILNWGSGLE
jgi:hypothetical protein